MSTLMEVVQAELGRVPVAWGCCRRAEIATLLRLSAAPRHLDGRLVVAADLDGVGAARRLHTLITSAFGYPVRLQLLPAPGRGRPDSTASAWARPTGRSWPAGSGWSTGTAGWCVGCPRG